MTNDTAANAAREALEDAYRQPNESGFDLYARTARQLDPSITAATVESLKQQWLNRVIRNQAIERKATNERMSILPQDPRFIQP